MTTMQSTTPVSSVPVSQLDPYSDDALVEPWETYTALQNLGAAVWLEKYEMFALTRTAIFRALTARVKRFHIEEEVRNVNNTLRGFKRLIVAVEH